MKRPITIFSTFCILLFLAAIAWFSYGIYTDRNNGLELADRKFARLFEDTSDIAKKYAYGTPEFSTEFIRAIGSIDDYSLIKLQINGRTVYSYPPTGYTIPSPDLVKKFKSERMLSNGSKIALSASIYLMKPDSIYIHSRFSFILILSGTLLALFVLLILKKDAPLKVQEPAVFTKKQTKNTMDEKTPEPATDAATSAESSETNAFDGVLSEGFTSSLAVSSDAESDTNENNDTPDSANIEKNSSLNEKLDENTSGSLQDDKIEHTKQNKKLESDTEVAYENNDSLTNDIDHSDIGQTDEDATYEEVSQPASEEILDEEQTFDVGTISFEDNTYDQDDDDFDDSDLSVIDELERTNMEMSDFETQDDPLFDNQPATQEIMTSPVTGLETFSKFEQTLADNLSEAKTSGEDISIAFLRIEDLDRGNSISKAIVSIISDDLHENFSIYEYMADGYGIIYRKADLNETVGKFDKLYDKITNYLKLNNAVNGVMIGIASSTMRDISAEKLIDEAVQALNHAEEDPDSPIIAFKANPEKYKEYMNMEK